MIHHASTEELSAYLDLELGFAEVGQLEAHCATCAECGARLASLRRVVNGLGRVERVAPPLALRQQIRRQVQATPSGGIRETILSALDKLRLLLFPVNPALRASAVLGTAVVAGLFAYIHVPNVNLKPRHQEVLNVEVIPGMPSVPLETTSQVAGREFVWTEDTGWVQRGLELKTPEIVDARSPKGRAVLTQYSELNLLLSNGSSVVLSYDKETVEIRRTPPMTQLQGHPGALEA